MYLKPDENFKGVGPVELINTRPPTKTCLFCKLRKTCMNALKNIHAPTWCPKEVVVKVFVLLLVMCWMVTMTGCSSWNLYPRSAKSEPVLITKPVQTPPEILMTILNCRVIMMGNNVPLFLITENQFDQISKFYPEQTIPKIEIPMPVKQEIK